MKNKALSNRYRMMLFVALPIFVAMLILDLMTKHFANIKLQVGQGADFIPGFIDFINVHNNGAAWNMFAGSQVFLIVFTFIFIFAFGFFYYKESKNGALFHISSSLILVGCLGNLIDRLAFGYVRDMIHFEFWSSFPVFNVADICVCVGVFLIILYYVIRLIKSSRKEKKNAEDNRK